MTAAGVGGVFTRVPDGFQGGGVRVVTAEGDKLVLGRKRRGFI